MSGLAAERDRIVASFRDFAASLPPDEPVWLPPLRSAAIERFEVLGFPSRKREDWKYTSVDLIARTVAEVLPAAADGPDLAPAVRAAVRAMVARATDEPALVFVDGVFAPDFAVPQASLAAEVVIDGLARHLRRHPEPPRPHLNVMGERRAFVNLNAAFQRDGAFVSIPTGVAIDRPIHIVHVATGRSRIQHVRNSVALGASARASVVEHYVGTEDVAYLTNAVTTIELAEDATLDHVLLECEGAAARHLMTLDARVARNAHLHSHAVSLGGALVRNEIDVVLTAPGAECELDGLFLAGGDRHVDNQTTIDHAAPHGTSRQLYKGVLDGRAHGIFNGKVVVRPGAQKTSAQQSNPNLLLTDGAEIDTRPNLEIHADDVKCAHGSSVGRLDEDALFFLRSRGIPATRARAMLCRAFAAEVIDTIPAAEVRERIAARIAGFFGDETELSA